MSVDGRCNYSGKRERNCRFVPNRKRIHGRVIDKDLAWSRGAAFVNCVSFVALKKHLSSSFYFLPS